MKSRQFSSITYTASENADKQFSGGIGHIEGDQHEESPHVPITGPHDPKNRGDENRNREFFAEKLLIFFVISFFFFF